MWEKVWRRIISRKGNPLFWLPLGILAAAALMYRLGMALYIFSVRPSVKLKNKVVSVGGITVGGAGKTPMVHFLAEWFLKRGAKAGVVCGGYGRREMINIDGPGVEVAGLSWEKGGDETVMLAESLPGAFFAVGPSKSEAARRLDETYRPEVILIDDAFQHRKLHRDLDIVLIDSGVDLAGEYVFPLGRLRETKKALARADLVILTKSNYAGHTDANRAWLTENMPALPIIQAEYHNDIVVSTERTLTIHDISNEAVYFFAGLADGMPLKISLEKSITHIAGFRLFPDHCRYENSDIRSIKEDIRRLRPRIILTTKKDYVKIRHFDFGLPIYYLGLEIRLNEADSGKLALALGRVIGNG